MADERRIVIELRATNQSNNSVKSKTDDDEINLTKLLSEIQHPIQTAEKATIGKNIVVYRAWEQSKALIKNSAMYVAGKYFNLTENYEAEQNLQNTFSLLENVISAGTSIIGGAIVGAKGGVPGAIAGAIVGGVMWGANTALNAIKSWDSQHMQITAMNIESSFQKQRLGLVDNGRGTQN